MLKTNRTLKAMAIMCALFTAQYIAAKTMYGSYYSRKKNVMYMPGANIAFEKEIITPNGISVDETGTEFSIAKPGIYQVSFIIRAKAESADKTTKVILALNDIDLEETQTSSTTAEISNAIGIFLIDVKKANSTLSVKNVSRGNVIVLDGLDLTFNINKIS